MKTARKLISLLLAIVMILSLVVSVSAADASTYAFGTLGDKTARKLATPGQYEISVSVPGAFVTDKYSEIIVMVDASISQGANLNKLKTMLVELGEEVLHDDGSMHLTLMGFGMGPATVGSFTDADDLADYLEDVTQADLRQGVSATNCEAALEHVLAHIENSPNLEETVVLFTSDGKTNMDETTFALSAWVDHPEWYASGVNVATIGNVAASEQASLLYSTGDILSPTAKLYPDFAIRLALAEKDYGISSTEYKAIVDEFYAAVTASEDTMIAYVNALWEDVLAHSGMDYSEQYSTSDFEKAFLNYYNGAIYNSYLYTIHGMMRASFYPDWHQLSTWGARAADAADKLAANEKVVQLHMVDFLGANNIWMDPSADNVNRCTSEKITYTRADNISAAIDKIKEISTEMFVTVYKDVTVTDPMSKWVTMDPSTIRIYRDDLLVWEYGNGWVNDSYKVAETPIQVEENENGRYEITWRIKDGFLLYTDRYSMRYLVDVDETAEGFQYDHDYPANDATFAKYEDENGDPQTIDIPVPDVEEPDYTDHFDEDDKGLKIYKASSDDGSPISDISFEVYHVVPGEGEVLSPKPEEAEYSKYMTAENKIGTITTNDDGYAYMNLTDKGYGDGFYLIVELPSEKVMAPADPFYIAIPMTDAETGEELDVIVIHPKNTPSVPPTPPPPPPPPAEEKGQFGIIKHSSLSESTVLEGAQFQLYRLAEADEEATLNTTYKGTSIGLIPVMIDEEPVTMTTDNNGYALSPELDYGLYFLVETKAPAGYHLPEEPTAVFVTATSKLLENSVYVANTPGVELPETGGIGTTVFTVMGTLLIFLAVSGLLLKKRRIA